MSRFQHGPLGWVLATVLMASLSTVCLIQWQALRNDRVHIVDALERSSSRIEKQIEVAMARWMSLGEGIRREISQVKSLPEPAPGGKATAPSPLAANVDTVVLGNGQAENATEQNAKDLPAIPEGVQPLQVLRDSLDVIVNNPLFNPKGKRPSLLEASVANAELTRAQGQLKTLDSEIRLEMIQGMEKLRPLGAFVEYASGEEYLREEGVLTSGEITEAGTLRMFYLRPDEFPQLYEKKMKKDEVAETSLRRLLAILGS